jgi:hypothetical protein
MTAEHLHTSSVWSPSAITEEDSSEDPFRGASSAGLRDFETV